MINPNAYQQYQYNSIMSASPERLLLMLIDGAIKFVNLAKKDLEEKNIEGVNYNLGRAQDIVMELSQSLDMGFGISSELEKLYDFLYNQMVEANIKKDAAALEPVELMLKDLKGTWEEVYLNIKKNA